MDLAAIPALGGEVDLVSMQGGEFNVTDLVACIRDATGRELGHDAAAGDSRHSQAATSPTAT